VAKVQIIEKTFNDTATGRPVTYKRLAIMGYVSGTIHTLELKLEPSELLLAEIILSSNEEKPEQGIRKPDSDELAEFQEGITSKKTGWLD